MPRRKPYEELTDPRNERVNATLTNKAWAKLVVLKTRSAFYDNQVVDGTISEARQTSGSIRGEHRKDLVDAIKQPLPQMTGIGLQPGASESEQKQSAGDGAGPV